MRRLIIPILLVILVSVTWANGAKETKDAEYMSSTYRFLQTELSYTPNSEIQIVPSQKILDIFQDEDNDVDEIFADVEPYLQEGAEILNMPKNVKKYIDGILSDNVANGDDEKVKDLIHDELLAGLKENGVERSYMILGAQLFNCSYYNMQ